MPVKFDYQYISYARFLSNIEQGNYTRSNNPELMPTKTIDYEIGFKQLVTNDISIDITMFYNEKSDYLQIRNIASRPTGYALYVNGDYATNKGMSFSLNTRRHRQRAGFQQIILCLGPAVQDLMLILVLAFLG
jgi:outer membrane cobalamin receptor